MPTAPDREGSAARVPGATDRPSVSVLVPCYNAAPFLASALESALEDRERLPLQVVVVDDGSTDGSREELRRFAGRGVEVVHQPNRGAPAARNQALARAAGEWCLFLDADDAFAPGFLTTQARTGAATAADIVFGSFVMTWPCGRGAFRKPMRTGASVDHALARTLTDGWYPPNAILWRTGFLRRMGGWDESLRRNEDGELLARALLSRPRFTSNFESHAVYRQHDRADRVSARKDAGAVADSLLIGKRVGAALEADGHLPEARAALAQSMYELAGEAHDLGHHAIGREAELLARRHGPLGPQGRLLRRLGTRVLGIEMRARLARLRRGMPGTRLR